jgi:exodeoxyribonuclease VII large subunit
LQRGYAMVLDAQGKAVTSKASAQRQAALAIRFADGDLDVVPAGAKRAPAPKPAPPGNSQPKLL